jgi:hypothetical protein
MVLFLDVLEMLFYFMYVALADEQRSRARKVYTLKFPQLQCRGFVTARLALDRYEVTVQTAYDIWYTSTAKAVARWVEVVSAVLLE